MRDALLAICFFLCIFGMGITVGLALEEQRRNGILHDVGIEEIRYCSINTRDVRTNWYEIVWIDKDKRK